MVKLKVMDGINLVTAITVVLGNLSGQLLLQTWFKHLPKMRFTTVFSFIVVGVLFLFLRIPSDRIIRGVGVVMCSTFLLLSSFVVAAANLFGQRGLGFETPFSGQYDVDPSQLALLGFAFIGAFGILYVLQFKRKVLQSVAGSALACGVIPMVGYLFNVEYIYFQTEFSYGMALPTSILFILYGVFAMTYNFKDVVHITET